MVELNKSKLRMDTSSIILALKLTCDAFGGGKLHKYLRICCTEFRTEGA